MKFLQSCVNNKYFVIFIISFILFISKWHPFIFSEKNLIIEFFFNYAIDEKFYCTKFQGSYFTLYYLIEKNNCLN